MGWAGLGLCFFRVVPSADHLTQHICPSITSFMQCIGLVEFTTISVKWTCFVCTCPLVLLRSDVVEVFSGFNKGILFIFLFSSALVVQTSHLAEVWAVQTPRHELDNYLSHTRSGPVARPKRDLHEP